MDFLLNQWDKIVAFINFRWLRNKLGNLLLKDKRKIKELENKIQRLEDIITTLEKKNTVMDKIPEGYEIVGNNVLLHKQTGLKYCWNCWNKFKGAERRVLDGDEYYVRCNVCNIGTQLKPYPEVDSQPWDPFD